MVRPVRGMSGASVNVLLAASDEDIRLLLRITMRADPRLRVTGEASSATEALALVAAADPDLIVLDRHLDGDRTAPQAADELKAAVPKAKILLLTALAVDREVAASTSIDCCLRKSDLRLLIGTAQRLLDLPSEA
jgi:DNA-binding NarL/FixJ family response regulator